MFITLIERRVLNRRHKPLPESLRLHKGVLYNDDPHSHLIIEQIMAEPNPYCLYSLFKGTHSSNGDKMIVKFNLFTSFVQRYCFASDLCKFKEVGVASVKHVTVYTKNQIKTRFNDTRQYVIKGISPTYVKCSEKLTLRELAYTISL